ncbi:serine/arginine repetitive matrix protein 3-like [Acinonyx jubatus]|uniref:Serine/arginine repetitive matrix protein 3-like n=1 Tax=Acinonyx jubatus TaxID=32536 RepID=A0ABM3Q2U6_ACIJB|nr:serine/arginine repetitive matrix protein 3-like [Acinonyx jubatus]
MPWLHPCFITPPPFPSPPLRPFSPNTHRRSLIVFQARLRDQDPRKPRKPRTCRPDSSPRGPQRRRRRFCAASSHLDNSPSRGSPGGAARSLRLWQGRRGAVEGSVVGGLAHWGEGRGSAAAGRGADPAALRAAATAAAARDRGARTPPPGPRPAPARLAPQRRAQRSRGRRREAGSAPRALLPPPKPARGERRASARRAAAALGAWGEPARGAAGAKLRGQMPDGAAALRGCRCCPCGPRARLRGRRCPRRGVCTERVKDTGSSSPEPPSPRQVCLSFPAI